MSKSPPMLLYFHHPELLTAALMGNKKTSVCDRKGSARYPRCVMYQYQDPAMAYNVLATSRGNQPSASTMGKAKNCSTSARVPKKVSQPEKSKTNRILSRIRT
jgi:hypothetical protein